MSLGHCPLDSVRETTNFVVSRSVHVRISDEAVQREVRLAHLTVLSLFYHLRLKRSPQSLSYHLLGTTKECISMTMGQQQFKVLISLVKAFSFSIQEENWL